MTITRVKYNISPYLSKIRQFRNELATAISQQKPFPIRRIFEILPIVIRTPGGRAALEHRGNGLFENKNNAFQNDSGGATQHVVFRDDELKEIEVDFPRLISFQYSSSGGVISLVNSTPAAMPISIPSLSLGDEFTPQMPLRLTSFQISDDAMISNFLDGRNDTIIVDGQKDESLHVSGDSLDPKFLSLLIATADDPCVDWGIYKDATSHCVVQRTNSTVIRGTLQASFTTKDEAARAARSSQYGCTSVSIQD